MERENGGVKAGILDQFAERITGSQHDVRRVDFRLSVAQRHTWREPRDHLIVVVVAPIGLALLGIV